MSRVFSLKQFVSSSALKGLIAVLQFFTSILYLHYLGATEFGKIIAVVASVELALLFALPGIQKVVLKSVATKNFPFRLYIIKLLLITFVFYFLYLQIQEFFYLAIIILICADNLLALNRTSLHAKKAFNLLVSLDAIRPIVAIILIAIAIQFKIHDNKHVYVLVLFVSILVEFIICVPYVLAAYRKFAPSKTKIIDSLGNAILASGFSYGSTILRKLPIVVAGSLAAELSALVSIFLQFFTFVNYLISAIMLQISIKLLNKELRIVNILSLLSKRKIIYGMCSFILYILVILLLDYTKLIWLSFVFNYRSDVSIPIYVFSVLPLLSFFSQLQFYNLFSKSCWISNYFILLNIVTHLLMGAGFYYCLQKGFLRFGIAVLYFHVFVFIVLLISDYFYGKLEKSSS